MGGVVDSVGGFLGLSSGPQAPTPQTGNSGLDILNAQNSIYNNGSVLDALNAYANGGESSSDVLGTSGLTPAQREELGNALATGATTGSKYATEQVQNNPILGQLFGQGGQLQNEIGQYGQQSNILNKLQNQGFQLTPEDQTLYGQASGNIARQFGQAGNNLAQDLASRGLASAPSGAAGAMFSGLQGSANEQLAAAQEQIMQQRWANTMNQIGQEQNFMSQLNNNIGNMGSLGANAINQQYGRAATGAENEKQGLTNAANTQINQNAGANSANMQAANFNVANKPKNFMDYATTGMGQGIQAGSGGAFASMFGGGGGGGGGMGGGMGAGSQGFGANSYASSGMAGQGAAASPFSLFAAGA